MTIYLSLAFAAGVLGVLFGAVQTGVLMKASAGNEKMREIAAAIQEGASAYLKRQYMTIGLVGIVILIAAFFLIGPYAAVGFLIGAVQRRKVAYLGVKEGTCRIHVGKCGACEYKQSCGCRFQI